MTTHHASRLIACAALLALVASFLAPIPVLAEEAPPPAEPTAEPTLPPEAAAPESEATPAPTDELPEGDASPTDAPAPTEVLAAEADLAELIEAAPDGTTVAVVGEDGALLPLASEEAAEIIAEADPVWCPASLKAPTPALNGCTNSMSFSVLLDFLSNDLTEPAMDGVIWLEGGTIAGGPFPLDGDLEGDFGFAIMSAYKLTLRGGWAKPETGGDNKVHPENPSELHALLQIVDWGNDVTLSDIVITGAPAGDALIVETEGNITLTRVQSNNNTGRGARLENFATAAKSVTITDSQFNSNDATGGLSVHSRGAITLTNVTAGYYDEVTDTNYGNTGYGATLYNAYPGVTAGITLKGVNTFSNNSSTGLQTTSNGPITASDLTASGNGTAGSGYGAWLDNDSDPLSTAAVTLTGTNIFTGNWSAGLWVTSLGPIKVNNLSAHSNTHSYGADLDNDGAATAQPVTLTGSNSFKYNASTGLRVSSKGAITINNLTANGSALGNGAGLYNNLAGSASPITLTGTSIINDNYSDGLVVRSFGAIKAANLTASGNGLTATGYGAYLYNWDAGSPMPITLTGANRFNGNFSGGLELSSLGAVSLQNVTASDNTQGVGLNIHNNLALTPQKVTLSGTNVFCGNYSYGLNIYSIGPITLSSLTASGNGVGASGDGAYVTNSASLTAQKVTLTGTNAFLDNRDVGLEILTTGAIVISNLTAKGNGLVGVGGGAFLDNNYLSSPATVSLTGKSTFSGNDDYGLRVYSRGAVALASATASGNIGGHGVEISNNLGPAGVPQKVTLSGTNLFNDNYRSGLVVYSYGALNLSTTTASGNGTSTTGNGLFLDNAGSTAPQAVTLSGSFVFDDNAGTGLNLTSLGAIKASNLTGHGNLATGAYLENSGGTAGVTLSGKNVFEDSASDGLVIASSGPITISSLTANGNGTAGSGYGARLTNNTAATPQKVTLTGTNVFNNNQRTGLAILSKGAISASNLSASGNGTAAPGHGAAIDNEEVGAVGGVTLTGISTFNANFWTGLAVSSLGAISLNTTHFEASRNGTSLSFGGGTTLSNSNAASAVGVTLKGVSSFQDNYNSGLQVVTLGAISASSLSASGNSDGAFLEINSLADATSKVTLTGVNAFNNNLHNGLQISGYGAIAVSNLTASGNGSAGSGYGAQISNSAAIDPQPITLTGYGTFLDNYSWGLSVRSKGAIKAANLTASGNNTDGASLRNTTGGAVGGITLSGTNLFNDNQSTGLSADSLGAITISNLTASGNGISGFGGGAYIHNETGASPQAVKLTGYGTFNDNHDVGLAVTSAGAISAANLTARGNGTDDGVTLDNTAGTAGVTLTGANIFTGNGQNGLFINSLGAVSLTRVTADDNTLSGLYVSNAASLTVTCGSFVHNDVFGLYVHTIPPTAPILIGVFASGNFLADLYWSEVGPITSTVRACPLN